MKIAITGSSGYIGKKLISRLQAEGYECTPLKRELWDEKIEKISELLANTDVVINLAGAPVLQRWTAKNKTEIYNSRIFTTQKLVSAIYLLPEQKKPKIFISASAVGIYRNGEIHNELSHRYDNGFLGKLVQDWEKASATLPDDVRRVVFRTGLVLGNDSKTITKMLPAFRTGFGGRIGNGKQSFPFIHIDDLVSAFLWVMRNTDAKGIYNLVAPQTITNRQFTVQLAKKLKRPAIFAIPSFILKAIYGEASQLLIKSPSVIPERLIKNGFIFSKPTIKEALSDIK